ncbi:MAG: helix-turn-helix transcriptional regulator [Verrucomicrobia bacterium]|jgi:DNA-binding transcriptional regulator YiaG|nr:helix-turn-helix transcriptional regulator [Verrucomicrobiota bacterium]
MSKIGSLLKEEIVRLARKEMRAGVRPLKRTGGQYRRDIAELKRQVKVLTARLAQQEKQLLQAMVACPPPEPEKRPRFSAKRLRSQRKRLGLPAAAFAQLVGVTPLSIYNWERGVVRPRPELVKVLASLRSLTKRDAHARLEQLTRKPARRRRRS